MSIARLRIVAIGCGVLAIAIRVAYLPELLVLKPIAAWFFGTFFAALLIPVAVWFVVARGELRRRPTFRLDADERRFVAGGRVIRQVHGIICFAVATPAIPVDRVGDTDHVRLSTTPGLVPAAAVIFTLFIALGLVTILMDRPRLSLDADGMTMVHVWRSQRIEWDEIVAGTATFAPYGHRYVVWTAVSPDPTRRQMTALSTPGLGVDPTFLLHAVDVYADHPERRAEIGTQFGLDRLQGERTSAESPVPANV